MTLQKWLNLDMSAACSQDAPKAGDRPTGSVGMPEGGIIRSGAEADILYLEAMLRIDKLGARRLLKLLREADSPEALINLESPITNPSTSKLEGVP